MKLALIGNSVMGQLAAKLAREQGHQVVSILTSRDAERSVADRADSIRDADVAIDFSVSHAVLTNVEICARAGVGLVEGTTGWNDKVDQARSIIAEHDGALIYGPNFSVGVQIFYRLAARAAELFRGLESYDPFIEEAHHQRKRDAPSGTALHVRGIVASELNREVPVTSTRAGYIPGTHRLGFDSAADQIRLTHEARSREGFAAGALVAAKWIVGRKGFYEFSEVFEELVGHRGTETQRK